MELRPARDAAFDALRLSIGTALAADRTLGGLCDYVTPQAPEPALLAIDGNEGPDAAVIPTILAYPAVSAFVQLAADVSAILGPGSKVSHTADRSASCCRRGAG
jgi:hypothetical protein